MAGKPKILRDLEELPEDARQKVEELIAHLKKHRGGANSGSRGEGAH
jgi:hypothetical protein